MQVRQRAVALVEVEAVADEQLVRDDEADVAHRQVVHETAVGPIQQGRSHERARIPERERLAEEAQREAGVDDVLDDDDVAAFDLRVQVLQQANPRGAARLLAAVARELDEVERVRNREGAREVDEERDGGLQRADEQRLAAGVVAGELCAELGDARADLLGREVDLSDPVVGGAYEAIGSLNRSASRAMSRR